MREKFGVITHVMFIQTSGYEYCIGPPIADALENDERIICAAVGRSSAIVSTDFFRRGRADAIPSRVRISPPFVVLLLVSRHLIYTGIGPLFLS